MSMLPLLSEIIWCLSQRRKKRGPEEPSVKGKKRRQEKHGRTMLIFDIRRPFFKMTVNLWFWRKLSRNIPNLPTIFFTLGRYLLEDSKELYTIMRKSLNFYRLKYFKEAKDKNSNFFFHWRNVRKHFWGQSIS